jgi:hypothetical protein
MPVVVAYKQFMRCLAANYADYLFVMKLSFAIKLTCSVSFITISLFEGAFELMFPEVGDAEKAPIKGVMAGLL